MGQAVADVGFEHRLGGSEQGDAVPTGPTTGEGLGWNDMAHRMVKMSLRSVM